jgi:hypothetical protein
VKEGRNKREKARTLGRLPFASTSMRFAPIETNAPTLLMIGLSASHLAANITLGCINIERLLTWTPGIDGRRGYPSRMPYQQSLAKPLTVHGCPERRQ